MNRKIFIIMIMMSFLGIAAFAQDLKVSVALLPGLSDTDKSPLIELVKKMDKHYTNGKIVLIGVYPFERSIQYVVTGTSDIHLPIILNTVIDPSELPYLQSSAKFRDVVFALYSNKGNKDINPKNVSKYKIQTDMGHVRLFDFPIKGNASIESALKMIDANRIDGWIFAQDATDAVLKTLGLKTIKKQYYMRGDVVFSLPKSAKGKETDKILSLLMNQMKEDGTLQRIFGPLYHEKFIPLDE